MQVCPFCAEAIQDGALKCKHCREWLPSTAKPPLEAETPEHSAHRVCTRCGRQKNTKLVLFKQNVSYFIQRQEKLYSGYLCFPCMSKVFLRCEAITLFGTWWGVIGALLGPFILLSNIREYVVNAWLFYRDA